MVRIVWVVVKMPERVGGGRGQMTLAPTNTVDLIGTKRAMIVRDKTKLKDKFESRFCRRINTSVRSTTTGI